MPKLMQSELDRFERESLLNGVPLKDVEPLVMRRISAKAFETQSGAMRDAFAKALQRKHR